MQIKTRMQVSSSDAAAKLGAQFHYRSSLEAFRSITGERGAAGLWRGATAAMVVLHFSFVFLKAFCAAFPFYVSPFALLLLSTSHVSSTRSTTTAGAGSKRQRRTANVLRRDEAIPRAPAARTCWLSPPLCSVARHGHRGLHRHESDGRGDNAHVRSGIQHVLFFRTV